MKTIGKTLTFVLTLGLATGLCACSTGNTAGMPSETYPQATVIQDEITSEELTEITDTAEIAETVEETTPDAEAETKEEQGTRPEETEPAANKGIQLSPLAEAGTTVAETAQNGAQAQPTPAP